MSSQPKGEAVQLKIKVREQRQAERYKLTGLLPGRIRFHDQDISCRPVDVSKQGLGIITQTRLREGSEGTLTLPDKEIHLKVTWGQQDFGKKDMWRYGLSVTDSKVDLEKLFLDAGCIK